MNCSTPGLPVHHPLPEFTQTHVHWCHPTISSSVVPFFSCLQSFLASGSFQMSQLFTSGGQMIGVSASASVLPMNIQDWSPLGWTGWISLQSKGLSRAFSSTTCQKHHFVGIIKIYFKLCSSSPRTLCEIMQYFSSLSMPMNHLEIVWKFQTPGPRSGCNQAFSIFTSHLRWLFWRWSSEHILSNIDNSYRAHNTVPEKYELFFLFFLSHFLFFLKMPAHTTPSLSHVLSPCPGDGVALKHIEGTVVSRIHWTTWEA